jgi:hypothetical protein
MAVPSSGPISLKGIINEIDDGDYDSDSFQGAMSLTDFSTGAGDASAINQSNASANRPNGSVPHAMSEFYSYDHDFNPFSSVIADFTISTAVGSLPTTVLKTFTLANGAGALTALISSPDTARGTLSLSVSISGDPGSGGTSNSATGYVAEGTTLSYSPTYSSSNTVYVRFKYTAHSTASNQTRTCTFTSNGKTDVVSITKNTPRSDRRLKTNIEMIGHSPSNIPIYTFNYKTDLTIKYKGVMAQDLLEMGITEPVTMGDDGFYGVDYNKIDVDMEIIS